ncbi:MAG: adenosylmethionine--8-amino-7-oxononanoate transaminase [Planctomycetes bacterium]|nr:adenosylmethionine--8-amino-7-oxononanoate transaminase [Planctomycetota bacterium]
MNDFIILGTDTDAGKTTFALLWLTAFAAEWEYWKPVETGESDSERIAALCPAAIVHPSLRRFAAPVAPPLAARVEGGSIPSARALADACPRTQDTVRGLLIETFGSVFSPLNDSQLQIELIRALQRPCVLVSSSKLGTIGRTLQAVAALRSEGIEPSGIILLGERDPFALAQLDEHLAGSLVIALEPPTLWTPAGLRECADRQAGELQRLHATRFQSKRIDDRIGMLSHEDRRCVWHPYTPLVGAAEPLVCVGARDEFLELADGRRVIDGISSWWTILHGHCHPPLMQALAEAAQKIDHVLFAGVTHPCAVELADLLLGTLPWCGGRVFYSDNGSTAVEVALKMAYQFHCHRGEPGRTRFVGFEHGYHGDTFGAMAVSRDPLFFGPFEPLLFRADILPLDADRLNEHLQHHAQETAAVILEPLVQGAGGMRMHTPETLRQIAEAARRHDVLFIADEVMTGGGRTGPLWAHQAAGIVPDLLCTAKTLTGGVLPLAATLAAPRIVAAFQTPDRARTFFHGHSFTANPLACAVAACNLRQLLGAPPDAPARFEAFWNDALAPLRENHHVRDVRIRGSIAAIELADRTGYLSEAAAQMRETCLELGVFLRPLGSVLYAMPPHCTSEESLRQIADAMKRAVEKVAPASVTSQP